MSDEDAARRRVLYCYKLLSLWRSVDPHAPRGYERRMDQLTDLLTERRFGEAQGMADQLAEELEPQVSTHAKDFVKGMRNGLRNTRMFMRRQGRDVDLSKAIEEHDLARRALKKGDNVASVRHIIAALQEIERAVGGAEEG